ncbi:MAG: hypothetical protein JSW63_06035, partial [Ignavibacterium sp.]
MQHHRQLIVLVLIAVTIGFTSQLKSYSNLILINSDVHRVYKNINETKRNTKSEIIYNPSPITSHQSKLHLALITFPLQEEEKKERSDLFYYILGILILIISAFILRQRYKQYLEA